MNSQFIETTSFFIVVWVSDMSEHYFCGT